MEMMAGQEKQPQQAEVKKGSLWEDVIDIFVSPAELFRRRENDSWVKPWLVLSVVLIVLYYIFLSPNREVALAAAREMMAKKGITEMPAGAEKAQGIMQMIGGIFQPIGLLIGILLSAFVLWLVGLVAKGGPRFKQAMMIVAWAGFVTIIQKVLQSVMVLMKVNSGEPLSPVKDTSFGVLRFLDPASLPSAIVAALSAVDLFAIWSTILMIVALKVICRWDTGKAVAVGIAAWVVMLIPLMGFGLIGQLVGGG